MPPKDKLASLLQRKAKIEKQIAYLEARRRTQERKEDTRLKVLVGAALLADAKINIKTAALIEEVLARAVTAERDRTFLQNKGWLKTAAKENGQ